MTTTITPRPPSGGRGADEVPPERRAEPTRRRTPPRSGPGEAQVTVTWPDPLRAAVRVAGEIDTATVSTVSAALLAALDAPRCRTLLVDLAEVDFLGAAGVGALAHARTVAEQRAVTVHLVASSRAAHRTLSLTGAFTTGACFDTWPTFAHEPTGRGPAPRSGAPAGPTSISSTPGGA